MHKSQNMSHKVLLPIGLISLSWKRADVQPVSKREFFDNPRSTTLRYRFVEMDDKCAPFDPWQLRDYFLGWKTEDWQAFFCMAGGWWRSGSRDPYISESDFCEWQQLLRESLLRPAKDWRALAGQFAEGKVSRLTGPLQIVFDWRGDVPVARAVLTDSLTAIIATVQIDALQGAKFRICARSDCKSAPFRIEARHKIFCSPECAHLVAVRKSRERAVEAKSKPAKRGKSR
jgi:hypothetical protein